MAVFSSLSSWFTTTPVEVSGTVVFDRASGASWSGLPFSFPRSAFTSDGSTLVKFGPGRVEYYDLPPRRRLFTPLAWLYLALALVVSAGWWSLRWKQAGR